jgi:CRP-like cAMP-binding protein
VPSDSLPPIVLEVEQLGLPFRFANLWINTHELTRIEPTLPAEQWSDFKAFARAENDTLDMTAFDAERPALQRALRRELARRLGGDAAAARVVLEEDVAFRRAQRILSAARRPADVFAGVSSDADVPVRRAAGE